MHHGKDIDKGCTEIIGSFGYFSIVGNCSLWYNICLDRYGNFYFEEIDMFDKLDFIVEKYQELSLKVSDPEVINDQDRKSVV